MGRDWDKSSGKRYIRDIVWFFSLNQFNKHFNMLLMSLDLGLQDMTHRKKNMGLELNDNSTHQLISSPQGIRKIDRC